MSINNFEEVVQRIVGQVKFKPTLSSWQDTAEVSKDFEDSYEHWRIEGGQGVTLYSLNDMKLLQILYKMVLYINEKNEDTKELEEHIKRSFKSVSSESNNFSHLGFRNVKILGLKFEFKELVDLLYKKIYKSEILDISCDKANDVLFSIQASKNGIKNNVMLGPVTAEEAIERFASQFKNEEKFTESKYKSYLYIDVDTYIKNGKDIDNISDLIEENKQIMSNYINYVK